MAANTHLTLPRVLVLFVCERVGPCPLPEDSYVNVLVEEPLPGGAEALDRVELRWPETGETFATFTCSEGPGPRGGLRWFYCRCPRRVLEEVGWPWYSLTVDMDLCGGLEEVGPGGESPDSPLIVYGPDEAGLVVVDCESVGGGGEVCVSGVDPEAGRAYATATCYPGGFRGVLPAHRGLQWAFYGGGGVVCRVYRCPGSAGDYPVPVRIAYVFYKPNVEVEVEVDGLAFVVRVLPGTQPLDVFTVSGSLF